MSGSTSQLNNKPFLHQQNHAIGTIFQKKFSGYDYEGTVISFNAISGKYGIKYKGKDGYEEDLSSQDIDRLKPKQPLYQNEVIGHTVEIKFADDKFYKGRIKDMKEILREIKKKKRKVKNVIDKVEHYVEFEDGDSGWIDLTHMSSIAGLRWPTATNSNNAKPPPPPPPPVHNKEPEEESTSPNQERKDNCHSYPRHLQDHRSHDPMATTATSATGSATAPRPGSNNNTVSTGQWTEEEHRLFLQLMNQGNNCKQISSILKSRTALQVRSHAQKHLEKLASALGKKKPPPVHNKEPEEESTSPNQKRTDDCSRRSNRKRVATTVNVNGYRVKTKNNYVVRGGSYVYNNDDQEEEKHFVFGSRSKRSTNRPLSNARRRRKAQLPTMGRRTAPTVDRQGMSPRSSSTATAPDSSNSIRSDTQTLEKQQRKMSPSEVLRLKHNEAIKDSRTKKEPFRKCFLAKNRHILKPFMEDKTFRMLDDWNDDAGSTTYDDVHQELFVQPDLIQGGELRDYQLIGLNFLVQQYNRNINSCLGDEMGLGKTLQTIALICHQKEVDKNNECGPSLVVCPLSVVYSWTSEFKKFAPTIRVLLFHTGNITDRMMQRTELTEAVGKYDVIITTYEMVKTKELLNIWTRIHFRNVILDEGHRVRNQNTRVHQGVQKLNSEYRLLLTGTPLHNNLLELHSLLNFLHPDIFTDSKKFEKAFQLGIGTGNLRCNIDEEKISQAQKVLSLFMLRRKKEQVEQLLPKKIETKVQLYKSLLMQEIETLAEDDTASAEIRSNRAKILRNLYVQLRKTCLHPFLVPGMKTLEEGERQTAATEMIEASGKLAVLDMILRSLFQKKHRVVLFSQFTGMLDILVDYCTARGWNFCRYDGSTSRAKRNYLVNAFNAPDSSIFVFLMSTRAGNLGLNLQAGSDTAILFDSDFNPQMDLQAQARVHRIGQTRTVHVYRLISVGTIEERIIQRTEKKLLLDVMVTRDASNTNNIKTPIKSENQLQLDIKFGSAAVFGDGSTNVLPTRQDIDHITDRTRSETDSQGKLKGNAFLDTGTFDVQKELMPVDEYEGVDFKKLRDEQRNQLLLAKPRAARELQTWDDSEISEIGQTKRRVKRRIETINGHTSVLAANNYDLEEGESSVFDRELAKCDRSRFGRTKNKRVMISDHQGWCQHCGDGGTLILCESCPVAVHKECCATIRRRFPLCAHHWCAVCIKTHLEVGGMLYRCQSCPNAYCEDCLPRQEKGFRILGKCDRFEAIGFTSMKHAAYIHCSEYCEKYAINVLGWSPDDGTRWTLPAEIDVSAGFGSGNAAEATTPAHPDLPPSSDYQPSSSRFSPSMSSGFGSDNAAEATTPAHPDLPPSSDYQPSSSRLSPSMSTGFGSNNAAEATTPAHPNLPSSSDYQPSSRLSPSMSTGFGSDNTAETSPAHPDLPASSDAQPLPIFNPSTGFGSDNTAETPPAHPDLLASSDGQPLPVFNPSTGFGSDIITETSPAHPDLPGRRNRNKRIDTDGRSSKTNRGSWTQEEQELFLRGIQMYGRDPVKIGAMINTRTHNQVKAHVTDYFRKYGTKTTDEESGRNVGAWTEEEHTLFLRGVQNYGRDWRQIASMIKTRDGRQVEARVNHYFRKKRNPSQPTGSGSDNTAEAY